MHFDLKDLRSNKIRRGPWRREAAIHLAHKLNKFVFESMTPLSPVRAAQIRQGTAAVVSLSKYATWHRQGDAVVFTGPFVIHASR